MRYTVQKREKKLMNSSGATVSDSPTSGGRGCRGGATSSVTDTPLKGEAVDSSPFEEAEQVLAYHGPYLYEAKVQKVESCDGGWRYYVHYTGWNKNWDEWLDAKYLLKRTEENVQKLKELKEKHSLEKITKPGRLSQDKTKSCIGLRGRKRKNEIIVKEESIIPLENIVNIQIPYTLKKQLVDDHECITHLGQLVKLPRSPNVYEILDKYFDYRVNKDGMIVETVREVVNGLRCYFDKALPAMLLYQQERQQYKDVIAEDVPPSSVYGAEHLLRLFVKLPEMLSCLHIETETLMELQQRLLDFLRFLQSNQSAFFYSDYQKSEGFVDAVKKEDN